MPGMPQAWHEDSKNTAAQWTATTLHSHLDAPQQGAEAVCRLDERRLPHRHWYCSHRGLVLRRAAELEGALEQCRMQLQAGNK